MKLLLITDQHFGVRNDNKHFINHYKKFYGKVVELGACAGLRLQVRRGKPW